VNNSSSSSSNSRVNSHALPALTSTDNSSFKRAGGVCSSNNSTSSGSNSTSTSTSGSGSSSGNQHSSGSGYQLMGQSLIPGQDESSSGLRKQLDQEYRDKKALEHKVTAVMDGWMVGQFSLSTHVM
jgi:hypothetical protein